MNDRRNRILHSIRQTIETEQRAVAGLLPLADEAFAEAVECIHEAAGRLVVSGIGKSAIIAQKIVATLNSTGTPALFLHAADAIHGDLGMLQPGDVAMLISKSGESPEIRVLLPIIRGFGNKTIALCGNPDSFLATEADLLIRCTVEEEACPNNLAPTSSTTAQLVMGDALAVALLSLKGFKPADFARYHPGGALGKRLYLRVGDLSRHNAAPRVGSDASVKDTLMEITQKRLGAAAVVDGALLKGVVTDGDIRRMLERGDAWVNLHAADIMNPHPKTIDSGELAVNALEQMRANNISQLLVTDEKGYAGVIHLHDLIREGII